MSKLQVLERCIQNWHMMNGRPALTQEDIESLAVEILEGLRRAGYEIKEAKR